MVRRALVLVGLAAAVACSDPTIRVYTEAQDGGGDVIGSITITVGREDDDGDDTDTGPGPSVLTLENADTSDERDVVIVVKGFPTASEETELVRRTARLPFDVEDVVVNMSLCQSCAGVDCPAGQTCVKGACRDIDDPDVDSYDGPESLPTLECDGGGGGGGSGGGGGTCSGQCFNSDCGTCPTLTEISGAPNFNFAITATEITRAEYAAFVAADPADSPALAAQCDGTSYAPDPICMDSPDVYKGAGEESHPQVCISACAALRYCEWAGWSLCHPNQWVAACEGPMMNAYPYGAAFQSGTCNGESMLGGTVEVGQMTGCEGSFTGLYHMSGNAAEWVGDCTDSCTFTYRGGDFQSPETQLTCTTQFAQADGAPDSSIGFRCCR
jgi:hypothetical protein